MPFNKNKQLENPNKSNRYNEPTRKVNRRLFDNDQQSDHYQTILHQQQETIDSLRQTVRSLEAKNQILASQQSQSSYAPTVNQITNETLINKTMLIERTLDTNKNVIQQNTLSNVSIFSKHKQKIQSQSLHHKRHESEVDLNKYTELPEKMPRRENSGHDNPETIIERMRNPQGFII